MLSFPKGYFQAEEIEGFFVSETMKRYWACCMDIINEIDIICKKHNITYYADWGTLLGAVRHKGFIPWDDDIDIAVKRPDYEKLLQILEDELPPGYWVSNVFNRSEHLEFMAGVSNAREINISKAHLERFYGNPFVATIDIFPLDYLPRDIEKAEKLKAKFLIIWTAVDAIKKEMTEDVVEEALLLVEKHLNVTIDREANLRNQLWRLANQLVMSCREDEGDYLVPWLSYINYGIKFDKHLYDETINLPFEVMQLPAPKNYEEVLGRMYRDWRTPKRGTQSHNYPCFKKQLDFLRKVAKELREQQTEN